MCTRNHGWLTFKQHLIGFVPGYLRMPLVDGQHHLTLQCVREGNCVELWDLSFSICERVGVCCVVLGLKLLIQTY